MNAAPLFETFESRRLFSVSGGDLLADVLEVDDVRQETHLPLQPASGALTATASTGHTMYVQVTVKTGRNMSRKSAATLSNPHWHESKQDGALTLTKDPKTVGLYILTGPRKTTWIMDVSLPGYQTRHVTRSAKDAIDHVSVLLLPK